MDSIAQTTVKRCNKCGEVKPSSDFRRNSKRKDGLSSTCKTCAKQYDAEYRHKNGEFLSQAKRQWRHDNRDRVRENKRRYYQSNIEREREARRLNQQRYTASNPDKARSACKKWRIANPEYNRIQHAVRKARKLNSGGTHTTADVKAQYRSQRGKCWWCSKLVGDDYHVDHLIPLARGGTNDARNIVISCPKCNMSKHDKLPHEWTNRLL